METTRLTSLKINSHYSLKNRVVVPPMASGTATPAGAVTEETLAHYSRLTESGAGLVLAEYSFVHATGRSEERQLGVDSDTQVAGLTRLAKILRRRGAIAGIQLTHAGSKSTPALTAGQMMSASPIAVPVKDQWLEVPRAMETSDIELWLNAFVAAADRAVLAGFDLLEFHSAHGYGLNQWLSPLTNQREDAYGGDLTGRSRLLREIIQRVRTRHPQHLLSVRLPGQDFLPGGLTLEDTVRLAQHLENLGVDILHVSSGIGGWRRPESRQGEGYLVPEAAVIQGAVSIPVIGVGGIESGEFIDQSLRLRKFALAAVGRSILKDPVLFRRQVLEGGRSCP